MSTSGSSLETLARLIDLTRVKLVDGRSLRRLVLCSNLLALSAIAEERARQTKRDEFAWFENLMNEMDADEASTTGFEEIPAPPTDGAGRSKPLSKLGAPPFSPRPRPRGTGEYARRKRTRTAARLLPRHLACMKISMRARFDPVTPSTLAPAGFQFIVPAGLTSGYLLGLTSRGVTVRKVTKTYSNSEDKRSEELWKILNRTLLSSSTPKASGLRHR
ncbi:hypothetical protein CROQUDRAFT_136768 [Cronartium quercuum f. sp. fusiforme G11]|uniref:Uncharacterized protein n=1 Tax=Cronartium quercuum f. sp. fusiforme G11 TaxID=708437 RepID=A0A9P6N6C4_9BASI|nr:hypothetical protein CROQUDRAFT_136768 [Cronartium quercuum f. sp. fusiforme G11]